jgi:hypothetical protein
MKRRHGNTVLSSFGGTLICDTQIQHCVDCLFALGTLRKCSASPCSRVSCGRGLASAIAIPGLIVRLRFLLRQALQCRCVNPYRDKHLRVSFAERSMSQLVSTTSSELAFTHSPSRKDSRSSPYTSPALNMPPSNTFMLQGYIFAQI